MLDLISEKVKKQYTLFPFPKAEYQHATWLSDLLLFFENISERRHQDSYLSTARILDAGCGTGAVSNHLAGLFPMAKITAIDFCSTSLNIAKENAKKLGNNNIEFKEANILELDLKKQFDVIISVGVLHHLSDMVLGFKNIIAHLKPDGYIVLWLYGEYGRYRLNLNQRFLKTLFSEVPDIVEQSALTKSILKEFPEDLLSCHIDVPDTGMVKDFRLALEFALNNDSWMVDQFLHANEKVFNISKIQSLFGAEKIKMLEWLGAPKTLQDFTKDQKLISLFNNLSQEKKLICMDCLLKPYYYQIVGKKVNGN